MIRSKRVLVRIMLVQRLRRWPSITLHWTNVSCYLGSGLSLPTIRMFFVNGKDFGASMANMNRELEKKYPGYQLTNCF